jgi:8-oxo-dGTP diphosphatase
MNKNWVVLASVFVRKNEKVLIAKRADTKSFLPGKYEIPGGHIEFGESPEDCLKRELLEEMHVDIIVGMPFYVFTEVHANEQYIEVDYFAQLKGSNKEIRLNKKDHSEYKWVGASEVDEYFDTDDNAGKAIKEGFRILGKLRP